MADEKKIRITNDKEAEAAQAALMEFNRSRQAEQEAEAVKPYAEIIEAFNSEGYKKLISAMQSFAATQDYGSMDRMLTDNAINAVQGLHSNMLRRFPGQFTATPTE